MMFGGGMHGGGQRVGMFAGGIPEYLRARITPLLASEPDFAATNPKFSQSGWDRRPYNLRRLLAPHRGAVAVALLAVVVETLLLQAGPLLTSLGIDRGVSRGNFGVVVLAAVAYFASLVIGGLATWLRTALTGRLAAWLNYDQRTRVFAHLQRLSLDFYSNEKAGRLMSRMTSDVESTNQMLQNGIIQLLVQILTLVVVTVILFIMNARLAAVTVVVIVPTLSLLTYWFSGRSERAYERVRDTIAAVLSDLQENLTGIVTVVAHNRQEYNVVHHRAVLRDYREANMVTARLGGFYGAGSQLIGVIGQAAVLLIGGRMVLSHQLTIGELTGFILYLTAFFAPIQQMSQLYNTYQQGQAAITKLAGLLATPPTVVEAPDARELPPIEGAIAFDHVTFGYDPERPVLEDIDLQIAAGDSVALVGPTGAGKSTVAKLITRFYDPVAGRVLIDGEDLREVTLGSLRHQLGVVPQEPFLFGGSLRDNIAFGSPDAGAQAVEDAALAVGLGDLLERLADGLDTEVGERGASLSSGERQLVALARAFVARPRILVLDEATSNLDLASEKKVEAALDVVLEGRTSIIIAHRLSTAMRADRIVVIDAGRVVEQGTHAELVELGGRYADMYATWISHLDGAQVA